MNKSTKVINHKGIPFNILIISKNDKYGVDNTLIYEKDEPMIEFYDARKETLNKLGQFVSSYYVSTLLKDRRKLEDNGLNLDMCVRDWNVSGVNMEEIFDWIYTNHSSLIEDIIKFPQKFTLFVFNLKNTNILNFITNIQKFYFDLNVEIFSEEYSRKKHLNLNIHKAEIICENKNIFELKENIEKYFINTSIKHTLSIEDEEFDY